MVFDQLLDRRAGAFAADRPLAHFPFDPSLIAAASGRDDAFLKYLVENGLMKNRPFLRGEGRRNAAVFVGSPERRA